MKLFVEYAQRGGILYRTYWAGIVGQLSYLGTLCALVLVIENKHLPAACR